MDGNSWSTCVNMSDIHCHIGEEMEDVGVSEKLEKKMDGLRQKYCQREG